MIDIILLAIVGIVAWCVASEGAWGAAIMLLITVISGLLAMNFFEPLATYLEGSISNSPAWRYRWDVISLVGLFIAFVFLFRLGAEKLMPDYLDIHPLAHEAGRWSFAVLTGYVTMAFLLTALHTAPLKREFLGFTPERRNLFSIVAPDRQWLGFMQYVSMKSLQKSSIKVFDGPSAKIGDFEGRWPSFPIRYASRRASTESGAMLPGGGSGKRSNKLRTRKSIPPSGSKKRGKIGF